MFQYQLCKLYSADPAGISGRWTCTFTFTFTSLQVVERDINWTITHRRACSWQYTRARMATDKEDKQLHTYELKWNWESINYMYTNETWTDHKHWLFILGCNNMYKALPYKNYGKSACSLSIIISVFILLLVHRSTAHHTFFAGAW